MCPPPASDLSRRDTSHMKTAHLSQLPLGADLGKRGWVHRNLTLRIAEFRKDRAEGDDYPGTPPAAPPPGVVGVDEAAKLPTTRWIGDPLPSPT